MGLLNNATDIKKNYQNLYKWSVLWNSFHHKGTNVFLLWSYWFKIIWILYFYIKHLVTVKVYCYIVEYFLMFILFIYFCLQSKGILFDYTFNRNILMPFAKCQLDLKQHYSKDCTKNKHSKIATVTDQAPQSTDSLNKYFLMPDNAMF